MPNEKQKVKFICPKCKLYWADVKFEFDSVLTKDNFLVKSKFKNKFIFRDNNTFRCPECGFDYRIMDVLLTISKGLPKIEQESK